MTFAYLLAKTPPPAPHSFLMYRTPFLVPRPRTSPSILHAATTTKTGAEKPNDVPFVLRRDVMDQEEDTGQGGRGKGFKETFELEGTVHQPVKKPTLPLSKHQAQ